MVVPFMVDSYNMYEAEKQLEANDGWTWSPSLITSLGFR